MKQVRTSICVLIVIFSVGVLFQQYGLLADVCRDECATIRGLWISQVLPFFSIGAAIAGLLFNKDEGDVRPFIGTACIAAALILYMLSVGAFCRVCLLVDTLWILIPFTFLRKPLALAVLGLGMIIVAGTLTSIQTRPGQRSRAAVVQLRSWEQRLQKSDLALMLFLDPVCPHCASAYSKWRHKGDLIYIRWHLIGKTSHKSLQVALAYEELMAAGKDGRRFLDQWYSKQQDWEGPAGLLGLTRDDTARILSGSSPVLERIGEDGAIGERLSVAQTPSYAFLTAESNGKVIAHACSVKAFEFHAGQAGISPAGEQP